jgi:hypothetical protein
MVVSGARWTCRPNVANLAGISGQFLDHGIYSQLAILL